MTMTQENRCAIDGGELNESAEHALIAAAPRLAERPPFRLRPERPSYASQSELIEARLDVTRARLRFAAEHLAAITQDQHAKLLWPYEIVAAEREIDLRIDATHEGGKAFPVMRLAQCFGIDAAAQSVLWVLVAHELCPVARYLVRSLATETVSDPTTDVLRRVVFGGARGRDSWRMF